MNQKKQIRLEESAILGELDAMVTERSHRGTGLTLSTVNQPMDSQAQAAPDFQSQNRPAAKNENSMNTYSQQIERPSSSDATAPDTQQFDPSSVPRDEDVTFEDFKQLQLDIAAEEEREKAHQQAIEDEKAQYEAQQKAKQEEDKALKDLQEAQKAADDEAKRRHEQARLEREPERRRLEELLEEKRRVRERLAEERRKEQLAQRKLKTMGVCPVGFCWIKQSRGYRCAGGSHFISNAQLNL